MTDTAASDPGPLDANAERFAGSADLYDADLHSMNDMHLGAIAGVLRGAQLGLSTGRWRFIALASEWRLGRSPRGSGPLAGQRQVERDIGALPGGAPHPQFTAVQVNDAPRDGQAQPATRHRAHAGHPFGALVAIEQSRQIFGGNAFAGVAHGDAGTLGVAA